MLRSARLTAAVAGVVLMIAAAPVRAGAEFDRLWTALGLTPLIGLMQEEGMAQTEALAFDYLPYPPGEAWRRLSLRIYDKDKMEESMRSAFAEELGSDSLAPLLEFFESPRGKRIVEAEIAARQDFLDPAYEESARRAVTASDRDEGRMTLVQDYIAVNDLVEFNVMGAMNSNYRFFLGLSDGGGIELTSDEMLAQVWSQEEATRADTGAWLLAFLYAAYAPLSDEDLAAYVRMSGTGEGQRLNRALFMGFERMYDDIYYALGLAVANQMGTEEL